MKRRFLVSFILFLIASSVHVPAQAGISGITKLTSNPYEDSSPYIRGDYLVWQSHDGNDWEIFLFNVVTKASLVQLTNNKYDDVSPKTDGNYVVWLGFSQPDGSDGEGFIHGGEIFLHHISSGVTTPITDDTNIDSPPQIAGGRVVWESHVLGASVEPGEIYLYDTTAPTPEPVRLDDTSLDDSSPRINDSMVVWVQTDEDGKTSLVMYDLTDPNPKPKLVPQGFVWPASSQTDGDLTVLTRYDGNDREIFVHDHQLRAYEQITDNALDDNFPVISGQTFAWVGGEGNNSEIFLTTYTADSDGDGVIDEEDSCPKINATGFDVDGDGCIDNLGGLEGIVDTLVTEGVISEVLGNSLISKVENAKKSYDDKENVCAAVYKLQALKNEINAQRGKKISEEAADKIIAYTDSIILWLSYQLPSGESC